MTSRSVLSVYLAGDLKQRWSEYCKHQGETASTGIRQVIVHLLARGTQTPVKAEVAQGHADHTRRRLEFRLTESELAKVLSVAQTQGMSANYWVASLVRAHLTVQPQFGMVELGLLGESNSRLLAIGRNLNQIAWRLNAGGDVHELPSVEQMYALSAFIKEHAKQVAGIMRANIDRWTLK